MKNKYAKEKTSKLEQLQIEKHELENTIFNTWAGNMFKAAKLNQIEREIKILINKK